jgi:hypothetical protein
MKTCCSCKKQKDESDFSKNKSKADGLQSSCKICKRVYDKTYYKVNSNFKRRVLVNNEKQIKILQEFVCSYLKTHPCVDCGESNIVVLDFDHLHSKKCEISKMIQNKVSVKTLIQEIGKCAIRCANCHRIKTSKQLNHYKYTFITQMDSVEDS